MLIELFKRIRNNFRLESAWINYKRERNYLTAVTDINYDPMEIENNAKNRKLRSNDNQR